MKKQYIIPNTTSMLFKSGLVCNVTSVQGNGPGFGGEDNTIDPN